MPIAIAPPLSMTDEQRGELEVMARSSSLPHRTVVQAKGLLLAGDGVANEEIARRCETTPDTVRRWRARFARDGVEGVGVIAAGRGRKPSIPAEVVEAIVADTLHTRPEDGATHWTTRSLADRHGVSKDMVARIWKARNLKPWQVATFKLSADPDFEAKLVDIVGLYLHPPQRAVVLCVDEKTQTQALDRTQPSLPLKPGRAGTMTHDYKRNGTTDLFAALNVATGEVLTDCRRRHTHDDFLAFLKIIDREVPDDLDVHLVLDNLSVHKHADVTKWLDHPKRARFHVHFTPTSASWLNLVERWFKELTDKRLRRGVFTSVKDLTAAIELWVQHWNDDPRPFVWHKTAAQIIAKVKRGRAALDHHIKSATDH
ncbi:MAG: IS630 family transposase [Nitriliruptorales bacterium]|nr:IS630 family transposase [Nitriliruptorales bacterium]